MTPRPPRLARSLLLALTPRDWREVIDGDLAEGFQHRCETRGVGRARAWYWRQLASTDVFRLRRVAPELRAPESPKGRVDMLIQDLRYAARTIARKPLHAAAVVATLAIGIGASTAVFSVVHAVLLRPLPYQDAERIVMVFRTVPRFGFTRSTSSYPDFADWRSQSRSLDALAAYAWTEGTYQAADGAERWVGYRVTGGLFPLLGVRPLLGRSITEADDVPGAPPVVLLSHATWQSRFGGDSSVAGRVVHLNGAAVTVLGVMPRDFAFPSREAAFWTPLGGDASSMERDANFLGVVGRLAPGVPPADAQRELTALAARIDATAPGANEGYGIFVEPRLAFVVRNARSALLIFQVAVLLVLALACANVTNLMLARFSARRREWAVRSALGAGRDRLTRLVITESSMLGILGGIAGLGLAALLLRLLTTFGAGEIPRLDEVGLDGTVLAVAALITIGCGLACAVGPAVVGIGPNVTRWINESGRSGVGIGRAGRRFQDGLVTLQVAVATVLTIGAALLTHSFARLTSVQPGFDPAGVVVARVRVPEPELPDGTSEAAAFTRLTEAAGARRRLLDALAERAAALPGVTAVGLGYAPPFGTHSFSRVLAPAGAPAEPGEPPAIAGNVIDRAYFEALRIPLLAGRTFDAGDRPDAPPVVIVNRALADLYWRGRDPLGQQVKIGNGDRVATIVGVTRDVRVRTLGEDPEPMYYAPLAQETWPDAMFLVVRATGSPSGVIPALRRELHALDPELPLTDASVATDLIDQTVAAPRFRTALLATFGAFAFILALVGVYGVIGFGVGERTHEIGVRMTLGAARGRIVALVLARGVRLTAAGLALGIGGALGLTRFLSNLLYGVTSTDTPTFALASLLLAAGAMLASFIPAWRASRADPLDALRAD